MNTDTSNSKEIKMKKSIWQLRTNFFNIIMKSKRSKSEMIIFYLNF